jgi:RNA polymerase sigma-70 factor, ECF subfamily
MGDCQERMQGRMVNSTQDCEVIRHLQAGDVEALGPLYDRFGTCIFRTALALTASERAADHVLHHSLLHVFSDAHRLNPDQPLAPMLYREVVRYSHTPDSIVRRMLTPRREEPTLFDVMQTLPRQQRIVMVLYYVTALSLDEIAQVTRCDAASVERHLGLAWNRLRRAIALGHEFSGGALHR